MLKEKSQIEFKPSEDNDEHGLCPSAETHWAIYLIKLIQNRVQPTIHTAALRDGKKITFIKKGENSLGTDFTFGAE